MKRCNRPGLSSRAGDLEQPTAAAYNASGELPEELLSRITGFERNSGVSADKSSSGEKGKVKATTSLLSLVIVLLVGYQVYIGQSSRGAAVAPPKQQIDLTGVKSDLLSIAQAERLYLATHGSYASIEQLQQAGSITFSGKNRRGYSYAAEIDDGLHFRITAKPSDRGKEGWPQLSIDETMQISQW